MKKGPDLFGYQKPRAPRRTLMRYENVGNLPNGHKGIVFECPKCGHNTGWIYDRWSVSANIKGQPCPKCNDNVPEYQEWEGWSMPKVVA